MNVKKILVPTDFSEYSNEALQYALMFLENSQGEIILLHVLPKAFEVYTTDIGSDEQLFRTREDETGLTGGGFTHHDYERREIRRDLTEEARVKLLDLVPIASQKQVEIEIRVGEPYQEILNIAQEQSVDMIVMGTHGRTGLSHLLMGSVAERVVRQSTVPVMTLSPQFKSSLK